jgi:hypothetical protein
VDIWKLYFTPEFIKHLVKKTNERLKKHHSDVVVTEEDVLNVLSLWIAGGCIGVKR